MIQCDVKAMARLSVVQATGTDFDAKHLLEAQRLRAELHAIFVALLRPATLVFDRHDTHFAAWLPVKLHDIGTAGDAQSERTQRDGACNAQSPARFTRSGIRALMQARALDREAIVGPLPLQVDQGALPFAENEMLQGGDRLQIVFSERLRAVQIHSCIVIPDGNASGESVIE